MDQYIKRKQKILINPTPHAQTKPERQLQIIIRQTRHQIGSLFEKIIELENKCKVLKQKVKSLDLDTQLINQSNNDILDAASMQKSSIKNSISHRETQEANTIIQQSEKLEGTTPMDPTRISHSNVINNSQLDAQKLSQSGKGIGRPRKIRKKF